MNQRELKEKIETGQIDNFYIFCGEDYFLKEVYAKRIAEKKGLKIKKIFIENEEEIEDLKAKFSSKGLFDKEKKLFYCKPLFDTDYLGFAVSGSNVVILDILKCKKNLNNAVIFEPPTEKEIKGFILLTVKKHKKSIEEKALDTLTSLFLNTKNTTYMNNTLSTIITFSKDKNTITLSDVNSCLNTSLKPDFLFIMEAISKNKLNKMLEKIETILSQFPATLFIHLFSGELIKAYSSCILNKESFSNIFKKANFNRYNNICKSLGKKQIERMLKDLYELDKISKSSSEKNIDILIKSRLKVWSMHQ